MTLDALAYNRFIWDAPPEKGDIERILGRSPTGVSVVYQDEVGDWWVRPVDINLDALEPWSEWIEVTCEDGTTVRTTWDRIITVAPARIILATLRATLAELDRTQLKSAILSGITRLFKTRDDNRGDVQELISGTFRSLIPLIKVESEFDVADVIQIGDGDTHAQELNDLAQVAISRAAQQLGVDMDVVIKRERVVSDEVGATSDVVGLVRQNEIGQRRKIAELTGWGLKVLIVREEAKSDDDVRQDLA